MYFDVTDQTRVLREETNGQKTKASAADLEKGQRVSAAYSGRPVLESYPSQTDARTIMILGPATALTSPAAEVFFPQLRQAADYPEALGGGMLTLDDRGCIRMKSSPADPGWVVIWPSQFELDTTGNEVRILVDRGHLRAQVGEEVVMGGGEIEDSLEGITGVDERTRRAVHERCPGNYWYASPEMSIPRRG